ncbi:flippase-like domain-containing protein [Halosimplex pelagicum]|uniref:Flippase-like domain-containing protein n=1 Tax=Halosimplex pelagicum TaxID=869886 RepID=A0A7D5PA55_9EURY|nr:flippase-like domain-containing protein [Halosimplex pelagicum]QLH81605.1 flippase-like domain-containing protein [Halosimplex pelagicum]
MSSALGRSERSLGRAARRAVAVIATLAAVVGAVAVVGPGAIRAALAGADAGTVALVAGVAVAVLVARGLALRVLLDILGHDAPVTRVLGAYVATTVVSTVVPGGQAGGAPVNGLLVARSSAADYEDGVAAVVAVSALTNLLVGAFGVVGVGYLLATAGTASADVAPLAAVGVALVALAAAGAVGLWRVRDRATERGVSLAARLAAALRVLPRFTPPDRAAIAERVGRFRAALARLRGGSPRQLATLVGLLAVAHALTVVALWLSFRAVGESVSVGVLLAVIPAAVAAAVVPAPGGSGVDAALVGLLVAGTSAVAPVAGAAVLVYRVATSGPALVAGGGAVAVMASLGWLRGADHGAAARED